MRHLFKDKILIRKLSGGEYDENGEWSEGGFIDDDLRCCIQPDFSGKSRVVEEMGVRSEDCYMIQTKQALLTTDDRAGTQADRVVLEGYVWEVFKCKPWTTLTKRIAHFECLVVRQDKDYLNGSH